MLLLVLLRAVSGSALPSGNVDHPYRAQIAAMDHVLTSVKPVSETSLSPDGLSVVWQVEGPKAGSGLIRLASVNGSGVVKRITAAREDRQVCSEQSPTWSPDGKRVAFLSECRTPGQLQLFVIDVKAAQRARQLTHLTGHMANPRWSADGTRIAFLFVDHATRTPSPMAAIKPPTGVIDDQVKTEIQRVAVTELSSGVTRQLTPASLYVFEFDWSPESRQLVFTGAPPPGDDNWYVARLYVQSLKEPEAHLIYKPELQIAVPRWSPDGSSIAFVAGLMSDEGATGGDLYLLPSGGGEPRNLTENRHSTAAWLAWRSNERILLTEFKGGSSSVASLNVHTGEMQTLWEGGETINASAEATSLSLAAGSGSEPEEAAVIRSSWSTPPEVWAGPIGSWHQISRENAGIKVEPVRAESVSWKSDSFDVQGWLVYPRNYDASKRYPMIVSIHGGPAWIFTPGWAATDFDLTAFSELGYFLLFPNPRGSYGQGERFTQANRRDWGFGDLSDIVAGVDKVVAGYPVDTNRVGIIGWSYGGSTAMFAVARTHRFRAAVAGAAACNLVSYYGENSIDQWMLPYFGASVYDDPAAYVRNSALTYVKGATTPTLLLVGERDGEAPPAQSFEFWHALKTLHVPTQLVVYPGEGHGFDKHEDRVDLIERSLEWFMRYMPAN